MQVPVQLDFHGIEPSDQSTDVAADPGLQRAQPFGSIGEVAGIRAPLHPGAARAFAEAGLQ